MFRLSSLIELLLTSEVPGRKIFQLVPLFVDYGCGIFYSDGPEHHTVVEIGPASFFVDVVHVLLWFTLAPFAFDDVQSFRFP